MQWICLLAGMVLGAVYGGGLLDSTLVGGLLGLVVGQVRVLSQLRARHDRQARELHALSRRLSAVEAARGAQLAPPAVASVPTAVLTPAPAEPDLQWDLPVATPVTPEPVAPTPQSMPPRKAPEPNQVDGLIGKAFGWLLGGNTVLRVGLVLLFLGLAFLLRYASQNVVVPAELRYAAVATIGLVLLGLGWRWRERNRGYALLLQGAGVAVLYLTVFAAMRVSLLIEPPAAFALLVLITFFSAMLAVLQDAQGLAVVAALGGFCAPLLVSAGAGSHVALFSYFALLNAGILAMGWFRAWRPLNLVGFVGTFGIGLRWGLTGYTAEVFWSTEFFLVLFFLMYLAIGLLFARRRLMAARRPADYVDGSLLFGPPLVGFGLQVALVRHLEFATAFSALALGIVYILLARSLLGRQRVRLLMETCLALGIIFTSLTIPLALDPHWSCAAWAVEGAGIFWLGIGQRRVLTRGFALLLQLGSAALYFKDVLWGTWTLVNGSALGALMLGLALLFSYRLLRANPEARVWERWLQPVLACAGLGMLYQLPAQGFDYAGTVIGWALLGLGSVWIGARWPSRSFVACGLFVQVLAGLMVLLFSPGLWGYLPSLGLQPFAHSNFWAPAWLGLAGLLGAWQLYRALPRSLSPLPRTWMAPCLMVWGLGWWFAACNTEVLRFAPASWQMTCQLLMVAISLGLISLAALLGRWRELAHASQLLVPLGALTLLLSADFDYTPSVHYGWLAWALLLATYFASLRALKPVNLHPRGRLLHGLGCALLLLWALVANGVCDGRDDLLRYVPLFNPLDLGLALTLLGLLISVQVDRGPLGHGLRWGIGAVGFALVSGMVTRTAHHWFGVPYRLDELLASMQVQAGLSLTWTVIALALMIGGHWRQARVVWLAGAGLIALVVAKLFFVELSNHGGLARIVSFMGVGVLLLVVGWFAPLPPRRAAAPAEAGLAS